MIKFISESSPVEIMDIMENIDDLILKLENLRTRLIYDTPYPTVSFIFFHFIPKFQFKDKYILIFSETICRGLSKVHKSLSRYSTDISEILSDVKIIKIGKNYEVPFGELHEFIPYEEIEDGFMRIEHAFRKLKGDDLLIFFGMHLIPVIYGREILRGLMELYDAIPKDITLLSTCPEHIYDKNLESVIRMFYDIVLRIKKEDELFRFGRDAYLIGVEQSSIPEIKPRFGRYIIDSTGKFIRV